MEACKLNATQTRSLNFPFDRFLMKLFNTFDMSIISDIRYYFGLDDPSVLLEKRRMNFVGKFVNDDNTLCKLLCTDNS